MVGGFVAGDLERTRKVYQQLGLRDFASPEEIKRAYRELALLHHPDKNPSDPDAITRFRLINEAYQILSDEAKRRRYDSALQSAAAVSAAAAGIIPTAFNQPATGAPSRAFTREASYGGGSPAADLNSPNDASSFGATMGYKARTTATRAASSRGVGASGVNFNNAAAGSPDRMAYSQEQNEEFRRKEKARFQEMKKRLEQERTAAQEQEKVRLQKQQSDQRREEQRRKREQERLREKLDKAIRGGGGGTGTTASTAGAHASTPITIHGTPLSRIGSSTNTNIGSGTFRSASANTRSGTANNFPPLSPQRHHQQQQQQQQNSPARPAPAYTSSTDQQASSPSARHTHSRHGTFANRPTSLSPVMLNSPTKVRNAADTDDDAEFLSAVARSAKTRTAASASPPGGQAGGRASPNSSSSAAHSPEMVAMARKRIEKDLEELPVEEHEEREHFLKLSEKHERALLISVFKQKAVEIESELMFRGLFDDEWEARSNIELAEGLPRAEMSIVLQCELYSAKLLKDAARLAHGLVAWHENVWTHMKQNLQRLLLLGERERLNRTAVVEEDERRMHDRLSLQGAVLSLKYRVGQLDERTARQNLCMDFYSGAAAIEASRRWIATRQQTIEKEEAHARLLLGVEAEETWRRGFVLQEYAAFYKETTAQRTVALGVFITKLYTEIASMKSTVANHNAVVAGLENTIALTKESAAKEQDEHEARVASLHTTCDELEAALSRAKTEALKAEEKTIEAESQRDRAEFDKAEAGRRLENVRLSTKAEGDKEVAEIRGEMARAKQDAEKELLEMRQKYAELEQKYERLRGKHSDAGDMLKDFEARDEQQRAEIDLLRRELAAVRGGEVDAFSPQPPSSSRTTAGSSQQQHHADPYTINNNAAETDDDGGLLANSGQPNNSNNNNNNTAIFFDSMATTPVTQQELNNAFPSGGGGNNPKTSSSSTPSGGKPQSGYIAPESRTQAEYHDRVRNMYKKYVPDKTPAQIDTILTRYSGSERTLLTALGLKYGHEPTAEEMEQLHHAAAPAAANKGGSKTSPPTSSKTAGGGGGAAVSTPTLKQQPQQQQQQQQKQPTTTTTGSTSGKTTTNANNNSKVKSSGYGQQTTSSSTSAPSTPSKQQQQQQQREQQNMSMEAARNSAVNRHARTAKLERRLYTAAAAASAASIAMATKESHSNSKNLVAAGQQLSTPVRLPATPDSSFGSSATGGAGSTPAVTPVRGADAALANAAPPRTVSPAGKPPLSPSSPSATPTPKVASSNNNNNNNNNNNTSSGSNSTQQRQAVDKRIAEGSPASADPRASYRELANEAGPKTLRQVADFEADDAAAVAQREAVSAFLQKQSGAVLHGSTDDPATAPLHVVGPTYPGKGILEYANTNNTTSNTNSSSSTRNVDESRISKDPAVCSSCDMNSEAISKLSTATDKLLARNAALVDDNAMLAQAVVSMNSKRASAAAAHSALDSASGIAVEVSP